ncbi:MAG: hypothetical protein IT379_18105 [Deltaproteobacteria bacterium]|nr:hypothetical protein [Deltaproteobacteria bacterium]
MRPSRGVAASWAGIALVVATASGCADPIAFCEGGRYEQTLSGQGCTFPAARVNAAGIPRCPAHAPFGDLASEAVVCAEDEPTRDEICAEIGRANAEACGLGVALADPGCLAAITLDSLTCDGLTNLCGGQRLSTSGALGVVDGGECAGGIAFPELPGTPGFMGTKLSAMGWPQFGGGGGGLELELEMRVTITAEPPARPDGEVGNYATLFEQPNNQFGIGLVRRVGDRGPHFAVGLGRCGAGLPARSAVDPREVPLHTPMVVRAGVRANLDVWIDSGAGEIVGTSADCSPSLTDAAGFVVGPFTGILEHLVVRRVGGPVMPPPMPPPMCIPPMCPP